VDNYGEILIYQTEDGLTKIDINMHDETVWLSIDQRDKSTISRHIKNVRNSVVANFATTASDGKTYQVDYYNLDAEREIPMKMEDWAKHLDGIIITTLTHVEVVIMMTYCGQGTK